MDDPNPTSAAGVRALVGELARLRRLARSLIRDAHLAEDAVQDTLVRALSTKARPSAGARRGWLATVLRNRVREERRSRDRRAAHESRIGAADPSPSASSVVEDLALHRRLVELVHGLDEPYRSVIARRFLHELSPREIARADGIPVKTVYSRIERGLARLRAALDRECGGDRSTWMRSLLPLATKRGLDLGLGSASVLSAKLALSVAAAAGLALVFVLFSWPEEPTPARPGAPPEVAFEGRDPAGPAEEGRGLEPAAETRHAVGAAAPPEAVPIAAAQPEVIRGSVRELDGRTVSGVAVVFEQEQGGAFRRADGEPAGISGVDGSFEMPLPSGRGRLSVESETFASITRPFLEGALPPEPPLVVVAPLRAYGGRVVDAERMPVEGAAVRVTLDGSFLQAHHVPVAGTGGRTVHLRLPFAETRTDAAGEFALDAVGFVERAHIEAEREGYARVRLELPEISRQDIELVLQPAAREGRLLHGLVVDAKGAPAQDAYVSLGGDSVRSDPQGRFVLHLEPWQAGGTVMAAKEGHLPAEARVEWEVAAEGVDPAHPLVLQLGGEQLSIRGRVLDAHGEPAPGIAVWTPDTTYFGRVVLERGDTSTEEEATAEKLVSGKIGRGPWDRAIEDTTDASGGFELTGLLPREYAVFALAPDTLVRAEPVLARGGDADVVLRLEASEGLRTLRGRVVSRGGKPLAGHSVALGRRIHWERPTPRPAAGWERSPLPPPAPVHVFTERAVSTDGEGRFHFPGVRPQASFLVVTGSDLALAEHVRLDDAADLEKLEIAVEVSCRFRVLLRDPLEADAVGRLDPEGRRAPLFVQLENHTVSTPALAIVEGRSGMGRVPEGEHTLVLLEGEVEVRRFQAVFEPGGVQEIRP
jgi:RNA polymerase sigma-70 factor (ECF subfamily)